MTSGQWPVGAACSLRPPTPRSVVATIRLTVIACLRVSWVVLFDGKVVTPVSGPDGYAGSPAFSDVDGDGVMEFVTLGDDGEGNTHDYLYRLEHGEYKQAEQVVYTGYCVRTEGKPVTQTEYFPSSVRSATLLLINGTADSPRSASIRIEVNGQRAISQDQVNENVGRLTVPVTLLDDDTPNSISCTMFGKPGAVIDLMIYVANPTANRNAQPPKGR